MTPMARSSGSRRARSCTTGSSVSSVSRDSGAAMFLSAWTAGSASTESGTSAMRGPTASGAPIAPSALMAASCSQSSPCTNCSSVGTASRVRSCPTASIAACATLGSPWWRSGRMERPAGA